MTCTNTDLWIRDEEPSQGSGPWVWHARGGNTIVGWQNTWTTTGPEPGRDGFGPCTGRVGRCAALNRPHAPMGPPGVFGARVGR